MLTSPDDPAPPNAGPPTSIDMSALGHDDDRSVSTSSSYGRTILSSLAPSSLTHSFQDDDAIANDGTVRVPMGLSLSLSLNPSMVDSSVFIPAGPCLPRAALSQSSVSSASGDVSSCDASCSSQSYDPELFANIGRILALASVSSDSNAASDDGCDSQPKSKPTGVTGAARGKGVKWWDQLQTDEDWDNFRVSAHEHLNALVAEELKEMKRDKSVGDGRSPDKTTAATKEAAKQNCESFSRVRQWLQGLYAAVAASTFGMISEETPLKTKHISSLVKEMADIQRQLEGLPPPPPSLPEGLPLDDLPAESRDLLVQYRDRLDAWRGEAMPRREELSARYVRCQEKLLAAIIDAEEAQFWSAKGAAKFLNKDREGVQNREVSGVSRKEGKCHTLGAVNDDGYIEVIGKESPLWDEVTETFIAPQSKCQLKLGAALFAALTAGAGFLLTLQSKNSR